MKSTANAAAAGQLVLGVDLTVNRLGFGAMRITGPGIWGEPPNVPAACRVLQRAVQLGVNFIDTADSYGPEVSEQLIARALYPYSPELVIATKGGLTRPGPDVWNRNARPAQCSRYEGVQQQPVSDSHGVYYPLRKGGSVQAFVNCSSGKLQIPTPAAPSPMIVAGIRRSP